MRARGLKPGFFENADLAELGPYAQLLFEGLWCLADREGRLKDDSRWIKAKVLPYYATDRPVDAILSDLEAKRFIVRYEVDNERFIQVVNFSKHQTPHVRESASTIPAPPENGASLVQGIAKAQPRQCLGNGETSPRSPDFLTPDSLTTDSRLERCEPKKNNGSHPPAPQPKLPILLNMETYEWTGVTDADVAKWSTAYPACDVRVELSRAAQWIRGHPEKRKSNWLRYITNWLNRSQNYGGTHRFNRAQGSSIDSWEPPK